MRSPFVFFFFITHFCAYSQISVFGFEPNEGQFPQEYRFARRMSGDQLISVTHDAMVLPSGIRMQVLDVPAGNAPVPSSPLETRFNFYIGNASAEWKVGRQQFAEISLGEISPGVRATFGNELQTLGITRIGRGRLRLNATAGADLSRFRVKFQNMGTGAIVGAGGGVWFVGGTAPGVFAVNSSFMQLDGSRQIPVTGSLKIESSDTLSVTLTDIDSRYPTVVDITFPNYEIGSVSMTTPTLVRDTIRSDYNSPGNVETYVARLDETGKPLWVTVIGGSGEDRTNAVAELASGAGLVLATTSPNLPVTSNASYSSIAGTNDLYVSQLDWTDGKLRSGSYAGFGMRSDASRSTVIAGNDLLFGGFTATNGGFLIRWRMNENRRMFLREFDQGIVNFAIDARMKILYATLVNAPTLVEMRTGWLSETGEAEGQVVVTRPPADVPNPVLLETQLYTTGGDEYLVSYQVVSPQTRWFRSRTMLEMYNARSSSSVWKRQLGFGAVSASFGWTPLGNMKLLFGTSQPDLPTTARARLTARCIDSKYFLILSKASDLVHSEYVPPGFDLARENEPVADPPSQIGCVAKTAGRGPTPVITPGELITITGGGFGPSAAVYSAPDANGKYPIELGGFQARIGGVAVPVIAVARGLVAVQAPFELPSFSNVDVEVIDRGRLLPPITVRTANYSLGLFDTGDQSAAGYSRFAALNQDGSVNSAQNPAAPGSVVSLFGSGLGRIASTLETGGLHPIPPAGPLAYSGLFRTAIGGTIEYLGSAPGLSTSVVQINLRLADGLSGGAVRSEPIGVVVSDSPRALIISEPGGFVFVR